MLDAREQGGRARAVFVAVMVLVGVRYFGCRARTFLTMQLKHLDVQPNEMGPMGVSMYATFGGSGGAQLKSKFKSSTGAETLSYVMVENSNNLILCMRFWIAAVMLSEWDERLQQARATGGSSTDFAVNLGEQYLVAHSDNHYRPVYDQAAFSMNSDGEEKDDDQLRRWFARFFRDAHVGYHSGRHSFTARAAAAGLSDIMVRLMLTMSENSDVFNFYKHPEAEVRPNAV
jgi:hypothetical protein